MITKLCVKCNIEKVEKEFYQRDWNRKSIRQCKECINKCQKEYQKTHKDDKSEYDKEYGKNNKEKRRAGSERYRKNNKEEVKISSKKYRESNKEKLKIKDKEHREHNKDYYKEYKKDYKIKNKEKLSEQRKDYRNNKRLIDPIFKLRCDVPNQIRHALKQNGSSKNGLSCLKYLLYSIPELKQHLENQFEPWMNWDNHGILKNWDDNDPTTWTWQLDHIIPHSTFKYTSMADQSFKECWALSNLRPYPANLNILDGATRIRHQSHK